MSRLVAVGRLNAQKNYRRLLNALVKVKKKYPGVSLKIYGEGALGKEIQDMIKELGLEGTAVLMGRTNDIVHVLSENDLFVMSSDYEGMPNALMEAMAFGMPCVSTDCPTGPGTLIGNNERGMLAKMDDGEELADKIIAMIEDPERAEAGGRKAREFMKKHYSEDGIAREFYEKCTSF